MEFTDNLDVKVLFATRVIVITAIAKNTNKKFLFTLKNYKIQFISDSKHKIYSQVLLEQY